MSRVVSAALVAGMFVAIGLSSSPSNVPSARAQSPASEATPTFEVASIKVNASPGDLVFVRNEPGGRFVASTPLRLLIRSAYQVENFRMIGGPTWIDSDRFDVVAKAPANASSEQMRLMVRTLLADRFTLAVHTETRKLSLYSLVLARSDRRLGPRLRQAAVDCVALPASSVPTSGPPPPPLPGTHPTCGIGGRAGWIGGGGVRLSQLAVSLSNTLNEMVLDRTGLTGEFDLELEWTPDLLVDALSVDHAMTDAPSIFAAVQEQLGLKLKSGRGPVDVLVIDHAERPSAD